MLQILRKTLFESQKEINEQNGSHQFEDEMQNQIFDSVGRMELLMNHWVQFSIRTPPIMIWFSIGENQNWEIQQFLSIVQIPISMSVNPWPNLHYLVGQQMPLSISMWQMLRIMSPMLWHVFQKFHKYRDDFQHSWLALEKNAARTKFNIIQWNIK